MKDSNGHLQNDDKTKASLLNQYFSSVYTNENLDLIPEPQIINNEVILSTIIITSSDLIRVFDKLNADKSPGPDTLLPKILL